MTIVMVAACPFLHPRGTPVRIQRMAEELAARGHRVHVVTYHLGSDGSGPLIVHRIPRVRTYRKVSPGPSYQKLLVLDPLLALTLWRVLRHHVVDVIHAHHYEGLLAAVPARLGRGIPLVYDAHTLLATELPYYGLGLPTVVKRFVGDQLDRRVVAWSDHVISVSDSIRDKLVRSGSVDEDAITVVSTGVEIELFDAATPTEPDRNGFRRLIFTGNLASYQGIDLLLEAFQRVRSQRDDVRLRIVTDSSFDPYEARARELGVRESIELVQAEFERIPTLLAEADIAVNPRVECEGVPMKLLNYMAASKPVVSFESSAPVVRHGETGWLAADRDVAAFAHGVLRLLDEPELATRLGREARGYIEVHHTWALMAERIETVYRKLLDSGDSPRG